jgi:hypothetical protein
LVVTETPRSPLSVEIVSDWSARRSRFFGASWVAAVSTTADNLEGELKRVLQGDPKLTSSGKPLADYEIIEQAIRQARFYADRPSQIPVGGKDRLLRRVWQEAKSWWSGSEVDEAWRALHRASQALLMVADDAVVKSQLAGMAADVVTALSPGDIREKGYLKTVEQLAVPSVEVISQQDRDQLRAIRADCDNSFDAAHADARTYRNTLVQLGAFLAIVLVVVALIAAGDTSFRSVFSGSRAAVGPWYVFELELIASLAGLTSAVLALRSYTGFQFTYGLPFVQAWLKGGAGAATGLMGVLLVQSGVISSLKAQSGAGVLATAIIFGSAQYLFTRLVDQHAQGILQSAGSPNDPSTDPQTPTGVTPPDLTTTSQTPAGVTTPDLTTTSAGAS